MSSIARRFGAPVIEPPGKHETSTSGSRMPARTRAVTDETRCITLGVRSIAHTLPTRTLAGSAVAVRSLRSRSTIITFSARSLTDAASSARERRVLLRRRPARPRALDRPRLDDAVLDAQEDLGRDGRELDAAEREERRVVAGPGLQQALEQRPAAGVPGRLEDVREVDLERLAERDQPLHLAARRGVALRA